MKTLLTLALFTLLALTAPAADFTGPNKTLSSSGTLTNMMALNPSNGCKAYDIYAVNTSASDLWLLVFDSATNQVNGATTAMSTLIPAGKGGGFYWTEGRPFRRGITVAGSTTPYALTNTSAVLTLDVTYLDRMF